MKKRPLNICIAVAAIAVMIASAFGLYSTERARLDIVSENESYIYCAKRVTALADTLGVSNEAYPVSFAQETVSNAVLSDELRHLGEDLRWIAEYDTGAAKLGREADKLADSAAVEALGSAATYAEMSEAALAYHQAQADIANHRAATASAALIAAFVIALGALSYSAVRLSRDEELP